MSIIPDPTKRPTDPSRPANGTRMTTVLTSDCEFKGELAFSGELELHGRLEGTIVSEGGALTIGEQAMIKAEIRVNDVLIQGKVQGNVHATGRIEIRGKAEVYGDLYSNRLAMDDGVVFVGKSNTLNSKTTTAPDFSKMFTRLGAKAGATQNGPSTSTTPAKS